MKASYAPQIFVAIIVLSLGAIGKETAGDRLKEQDVDQKVKSIFLCVKYTIIGGHPLKGPLYRDKCFIQEKDGKLFMTRDFDGKSETAELTRSQEKQEGPYTWNANFPKAKIRISYLEGSYHDNHPVLFGEVSRDNAAATSESFGVETAYPDIYSAPGHLEAEPSGADQPATKPADKVPAKTQPSTPTPKVVPR